MKTLYNYSILIKGKTKLLTVISLFMIVNVSLAQSGEVINLGLYGGASQDFAWAYSTNRLFSAVETPASIFYSDDNCATWIQPFPNDSMEYTTNGTRRGWGGGGRRVVTNWNSEWVGVMTSESGGTLNSSVISFNGGDSATFQTAYDSYILNQIDPSFPPNTSVSAIAMTDSWYYTALSTALTRINDTSTYGAHNILLKTDTVPEFGTYENILWVAASSDPSGFPVLLVVSEPGSNYGKLFSWDSTSFTEITGIDPSYGFEKIFVHPADTSLDTLIVSTQYTSGQGVKVYRSYNTGSSWTEITPSGGTNWALQNADYNPDWVSLMPQSNGLRLSFPGVDKSDNLGDSWSNHMMPDNASATHPVDTNYVVGSNNKGPQLSSNGAQGSFNNPDNEGHAAVRITKIAQRNTNLYYVATKAGLGYTTAYQDPSVTGVDQWRPPYGDFPISGIGGDGGVNSVAVDPNDDNHVIVGAGMGFYVSTTGPTGFYQVSPTGWDTGTQHDDKVLDIKFINSDTIVAVTGTGSNVLPNQSLDYGNIWMSYDGGSSWTKVAVPTDIDGSGASVTFEQANCAVVGKGVIGDTIIYVGCGYYDSNYPKEDGQLWKSTDYGVTWSFVNYGPTGLNGGTTRMPIYDLDVHPYPDSNELIYIASGENLDYAFCKSTDGGATMNYLNVAGHGAFSSCLVKLTNPDIVSVAARRNLFRVNSILNSSTTVFEGMPGEFVPDLETGSTLLGTTTGLYKLVEEPGSYTTIWNGTGNWTQDEFWSNGIPFELSNAIIETGTVNVNMNGKAYDVTIIPGANVTVDESQSLSIDGNFTLESDETGYASFIDDGTITIAGDVKVERYITADQWHYITPPISDALSGVFMNLWLDYWDESANSWIPITSTTEDLYAGKGYKTWASGGTTGDVTLEFLGTMNTGDYSPIVSLTGSAEDYGWNMVGNSFPSAIDWGTDNDPNLDFTLTGLDNTIYLWNGDIGQYATYNPSGNGGDGQGTNGGNRYIAAMQGFFVHANATSPSMTIPQSSRTHSTQQFRQSNSVSQSLSLTVHSANYSDELIVTANDQATVGFDTEFDAYKLFGINAAPQFYSISDYETFAVNHQPMTDHSMDIPLGFQAGSPETHTIVVAGAESFGNNTAISLEDLKENVIIDLKSDSTYTYFGSPSDDPNRFILHIDANAVGITIYHEQKENLIYISNNMIIVENIEGKFPQGDFKIYDILGRPVLKEKLGESTKQIFDVKLISGTYIAMICNGNDIQTKKLIIK